MKIPSLLNRIKSVKKQLKGTRLIVVLVIVAVLLVGATSVAVYAIGLQKKKIQVVEKVQDKPANPPPKEEQIAPVAVEEKTITPANTQPAPAPQGVPSPSQPVVDRPKPITAQIGWWGGAYYYDDQGAWIVNFGSTALRIIGFIGGELRWQAEANVDGAIRVINSGSATIAPNQLTYDIPQFDNRELPYINHSGNILLRMHITSPNDVATEWRVIASDTF